MGLPRLLHQVWVSGGAPLPPLFEKWSGRWRELHPQWGYILWTDCPAGFFVEPLYNEARVHVPERNIGQFKSDVLRYELLYQLGGVYIDCDFEPQHPIDDLAEDVECFAAWEHQDRWIGNAVMGSVPGSPFLRRVLDGLDESLATLAGRRPAVSTGPQYLTKLYRQDPTGLTVLDQDLFYPYRVDELHRADERFPEARAIHRWSNKLGLAR